MSIVLETEQLVTDLLTNNLSNDHRYHDLNHTFMVREASIAIGAGMGLSSDEMEILELAALLHDTGFTEVYEGHELASTKIAQHFLEAKAYPKEKLAQVIECIDVTFPPKNPTNLLEKILKDADLCNLGKKGYFKSIKNLRYEWKVFRGQSYTDQEWNKLNFNFLTNHQYYTSAAIDLYVPQKDKNLKRLKKMVKNDNKNSKATKEKPVKEKPAKVKAITQNINSNKSAQMMFKTALRNHLDLSSLADNKANIMLSVNALILTIVIPLAATRIGDTPYLIIPIISLVATCLGSMIYATLATRPIKMNGYTSQEQIKSASSNLFFFGNFYRMSYSEYQEGMQHIIADEESLESAIMRDLYFLGKSLGTKYNQLRTCYTIFMFGIIVTVILFGIRVFF